VTWKLARIADPGKYQARAADTKRSEAAKSCARDDKTTPENISGEQPVQQRRIFPSCREGAEAVNRGRGANPDPGLGIPLLLFWIEQFILSSFADA